MEWGVFCLKGSVLDLLHYICKVHAQAVHIRTEVNEAVTHVVEFLQLGRIAHSTDEFAVGPGNLCHLPLGGHGDLANELGELGAALRVSGCLVVLDLLPLAMTGHFRAF